MCSSLVGFKRSIFRNTLQSVLRAILADDDDDGDGDGDDDEHVFRLYGQNRKPRATRSPTR